MLLEEETAVSVLSHEGPCISMHRSIFEDYSLLSVVMCV